MPHIRFNGCKLNEVKEINTKLLNDLSLLLETPKDHFTFEYVSSTFVFEGNEDENRYPFVEVLWFKRDNKKQEVANTITDALKQFGYEYVTVYFRNLEPNCYFENKQHF